MSSVVLGVLLLQAAGQQQTQQQQQQPQQQPASASSSGSSLGSDLLSIDRIRKELERRPALTSTMPDPNLPIYRLRVEGNRFQLPTWQQNFVIPQSSWVRQPLGGADYYEMQRLITPPQAWGSAAFSNRDVLGMFTSQVTSALAVALIKRGLEARRNAAPARARAEVQQELAEIAAHNARVAAGLADEDGDAKKTAEKKAAEKKKQDEAAANRKKKNDRE